MWKPTFAMCAAVCGVAGLVGVARAEPGAAPMHGGWVVVHPVDPDNAGVALVQRAEVTVPAATVDRALHEQPLWPFMAEVRVVGTTTYIDPQADYLHNGTGGLDENHWLVRAQREFITEHTNTSPYIIAGSPQEPVVAHFEPTMIFMKPDLRMTPHQFTPMPIPNAPIQSGTEGQVVLAK